MKPKKANEEAENLRMTVRLSNAACKIVDAYMAQTGYGAGAVVATLVNLGDLAIKRDEQTLQAARKVLIAQADLFLCQEGTKKAANKTPQKPRKVAAKKEGNQ